MSTVPIRKKVMALGDGTQVDRFVVPALGIQMGSQKKLIPNPSGQEACIFDTLDEAIDAIGRAGFDYEYEGRRTSTLQRTPSPSLTPTVDPLEEALPRLRKGLDDRENPVVAQSVYALGELRDGDAIEALVELVGHEDAEIRKKVAEALSKLGMGVIQPLAKAYDLAKDKTERTSVHSRLTVINTYGEMAQRQHLELLEMGLPVVVDALSDESWLIRSQAASVIGQVAALRRQFQDD